MKRKGILRSISSTSLMLAVFTLVSLVGIIATYFFAAKANKTEHALSFDWTIDSVEDNPLYVKCTSGEAWDDNGRIANKYDVTLHNGTSSKIHGWNISAPVPEGVKIDSSWNGIWFLNEQNLMFEPAHFIDGVESGEEKTFGLVLYSVEPFDMDQITLNYLEKKAILSYPLYWVCLIVFIGSFVILLIHELINTRIRSYAKSHAAYKDLVNEALRTIANIIDTKDEYTKGHSVRVAIYSRMIAERMGLDDYEQERIYYIGLLHDIGKVGIPVSILTKPGRLSDEEFEIIKRHPYMGSQIMKDFSSIPGVQNGIRYHHERYDGKGYNEGLKGEEIPLEGRIICIADSYDAMSSKRCYRNALSYDFILEELKKNAGIQFDPKILPHMVKIIEEGYAPISDAEMEEYEI